MVEISRNSRAETLGYVGLEYVACKYVLNHARDVYTRRNEGISIWVVRSTNIVASDPGDAEALFEPAKDKIYRHPTFYEIPDGVENI